MNPRLENPKYHGIVRNLMRAQGPDFEGTSLSACKGVG